MELREDEKRLLELYRGMAIHDRQMSLLIMSHIISGDLKLTGDVRDVTITAGDNSTVQINSNWQKGGD